MSIPDGILSSFKDILFIDYECELCPVRSFRKKFRRLLLLLADFFIRIEFLGFFTQVLKKSYIIYVSLFVVLKYGI